ncbi:MAG: YkvA family protein [Cyanobacteria bacterium P01_F01_bin.153]
MAIGALVYLISPLDVIPDVIPITGLTDDAALIVSVISTLALELGPYLEKSVQKSMKEGVAVAEELADIEVKKHNRIVRATLVGSICAAVLAIAVKFTLSQIG